MTQQHSVTGVVVGANNVPLEGASVKIYRSLTGQTGRIGYGRTEENGQYVAGFDAGGPVIVRYDHHPGGLDNCHPAVISHLSGANNHTVNVVMYKVGMHYERDDLLDILSSYERVYMLDISNDVPVEEIRNMYRAGLGMMKHVDEITKRRYREVIGLYDQGA